MKNFLSWHKHLKQPSALGFCISLGAHVLAGAWLLGAFATEQVASSGNAAITMSLASINTNAPYKAYSKPPKPNKPHHKKPHHKYQKLSHHSKHKIPASPMPTPPTPTSAQEIAPKEIAHQEITPIESTQSIEEHSASNQHSQGSTQESLAHRQGINDEFYQKIQEAIARYHNYPQLARIRGIQGIVEVEFVLLASGAINDVRVVRSNTGDILNRQAVKTVMDASRYFPKPSHNVRMRIPIHYGLTN